LHPTINSFSHILRAPSKISILLLYAVSVKQKYALLDGLYEKVYGELEM
jgi:hypothetical protein